MTVQLKVPDYLSSFMSFETLRYRFKLNQKDETTKEYKMKGLIPGIIEYPVMNVLCYNIQKNILNLP